MFFHQIDNTPNAAIQQAVWGAAADIPDKLIGRLSTADKLGDADRAQIIQLATQALAGFFPPAEARAES